MLNSQLSKRVILSVFFFFALFGSGSLRAAGDVEEFEPSEMIMHHITDSYSWHLFDIGDFHATIYLPIIIYSKEKGLLIFMSSNLSHGQTYQGFKLEHSHLTAEDGHTFYDLSITKNVLALFMNATIMLLIFMAVARYYKRDPKSTPSGIQSFFEPVIVYIRDDVAKPNVGEKYERYLPYLLTLFFFILFGNLLGLLPGAANLTGNIAVTSTLAIFTLILTLTSAKSHYWQHIFNTPGVPWWLKPIMTLVEVIGIFSKPFSLLLRLFVAITAGHIVILSLLGLTFIFQSFAVGIGSALIVTFINLIEILVAAIQAYIFTLFTALYIGMALEEQH